MKKDVEEKASAPQNVELDLTIEELEHRSWLRPASLNAYKVEKPLTEILLGVVRRRPDRFRQQTNDDLRGNSDDLRGNSRAA